MNLLLVHTPHHPPLCGIFEDQTVNDDANEWEWVNSADLEYKDTHNSKDVFLMKTEDCENWKV